MIRAISASNLSKRYFIRHSEGGQRSLKESFARVFRRLSQSFARAGALRCELASREEFWALKDVSFDVGEGERVGLIGRNGAGKSTLLKVLSRITEPTTGRIGIKGRIASLLEVGTGFNPELTGRENVFLNGAILGMSRLDIRRRFDDIVSFAEVERFLDTPVKHYSSGMYMRLAFAVAAHLEPEILIVDEVLAVGDAKFQRKCLGKMRDVGNEGRTVLFVSHSMQAVRQLCDTTMVLREGRLSFHGPTDRAIQAYLQESGLSEQQGSRQEVIRAIQPDPSFRLEAVEVLQDGEEIGEAVESGKPLEVVVRYAVTARTTGLRVFVDICDQYEELLLRTFHDEDSDHIPVTSPGRYVSRATIPPDILGPTRYSIRVLAALYSVRQCIPDPGVSVGIKVEYTGRRNRAYVGDPFREKLAMPISWTTSPAE